MFPLMHTKKTDSRILETFIEVGVMSKVRKAAGVKVRILSKSTTRANLNHDGKYPSA